MTERGFAVILAPVMIFLSGCAVAVPLLVAWVKVRVWEVRASRNLP